MSRLIDADAIDWRKVPGFPDETCTEEENHVIEGCMSLVDMQPTVDAIPVVHCKDCIFHGGYTGKMVDGEPCYATQYCNGFKFIATDDFYCGYGRTEDGRI